MRTVGIIASFLTLLLYSTGANALTLYCEFDNLGGQTFEIGNDWHVSPNDYRREISATGFREKINRKTGRYTSVSRVAGTTVTHTGTCRDVTGAPNKF
jgi:hypothetical protein